MALFFLKIYDFLSRRRRLAGAACCVLLLLCALSALRMNYEEDISAFMPADGRTAKYTEVFASMGGQDKIAVIFRQQTDSAAAEDRVLTIGSAIDAFGEAVARRDTAHIVRNLQTRVDETAMLDMLEEVWRTYPALLDEADYRRMDSLLADPGFLSRQMERNRQALMLPTSGLLSRSLPYDPLGMSGGVTDRLRRLNVSDAYHVMDGCLFKDSAGIVLLESPFGMSESRDNARLQTLLDSCMADVRTLHPTLSLTAVGAPLIAVTNADQIKRDSLLAVSLAGVLIFLILIFSFRRAGDLLWIGVSVLAGWLFALGTIALLRDGLSLIVIGIGSVIIGIAVNYPLHFIDHLKHETDLREALREMTPPLLVGNITTVSAFLCLVLLDARAMRDLGLFGSLTLIGTILFVLIVLPLFVRPRRQAVSGGGRVSPGRLSLPRTGPVRRVMPWVVLALTLFFAWHSRGTSFDSDMRHINYMLPEQREGLKFLSTGLQAQGDSLQTLYAVAEGRTLDEALRRNELLTARLTRTEGVETCTGIGGLLPSDSLLACRRERWESFWQRHPDIRARLAEAAAGAGFSAGAFRPFEEMAADGFPSLAGQPEDPAGSPFYRLVGHNFVMRADSGYRVVSFAGVSRDRAAEVRSRLYAALPAGCFLFTQTDVSSRLAETLSRSFDYIGWVCGLVVFIFLWLSFGSIELSLLAFLPLAVGWIWILGIMQLLGMQFNIVNIILATFIFGQGDDYTIFITEGLMYEYTTGRRRLERYKDSVALSALIMFIGIGALVFSRHPAMRSLGEVAIIGMLTVVVMAWYLPPLVFRWMTEKHGRPREYPVTLWRLASSVFSFSFFLCGMYFLLIPFTWLVYRPLQCVWNGEGFYHRLLQRISHFVIRHVPGVKFRQTGAQGEDFSRPAVIICNHQSHLDLMCVMQLSPKVVVLTNDWVWRNPFYGPVIHTAEFYPVSNGYDHNFPRLRDLVNRGYSIVVFPEGTRTPDGRIGRFHKGAFTLAKALGVDILPLYIHGLYDVLPKHDFMLRRGSVTLEIGSRLPASELAATTDRELASLMRRRYADHYADMRRRLETPDYWAPFEACRRKYKLTGLS